MKLSNEFKHFLHWAAEQDMDRKFGAYDYTTCFIGQYIKANPQTGLSFQPENIIVLNDTYEPDASNFDVLGKYFNLPLGAMGDLFTGGDEQTWAKFFIERLPNALKLLQKMDNSEKVL